MSSPRPASSAKRRSVQHNESPLSVMKEAGDAQGDDDEEVIHVDQPAFALPVEGNTPSVARSNADPDESSILAADELALHPEQRYMTPAIELDPERHHQYFDITPSNSRPHSRSNSIQHSSAPQFNNRPNVEREGTPLEDVKEYEPLFPEEEAKKCEKKRKFKEDKARHQFRSKDVWEDAPDSLLHETVVETPQRPEFSVPEAEHEPKELFEDDEAEQARKEKLPSPEDTAVKSFHKQMFNKGVTSEMNRPSVRHRFPSQDIWEDTPDSLMHTTEISPEESEPPSIPARPTRSREEATSPPEAKKVPSIPDRPKPQVPRRPSKEASTTSSDENTSLSRSISKEKPPVPARPMGSKIAALKGSFMTDLESRLRTGPQAPPKQQEKEAPEEPEAKAPLADARKGRARGPARRKPGVSPAGGEAAAAEPPHVPKVSFVSAVTVWEINEDGVLSVATKKAAPAPVQTAEKEVQTGQTEIEVPKEPPETGTDKATIYVGGRAQEPGTVVVKDGEEYVGTDETLPSIPPMTSPSSG
jgi:AIM21-like protein